MRKRVLITCEHGGNRIPAPYRNYFTGHEALLRSHRGHDPGALVLARELARACSAPLVYSTTSRLLIELNRSPGHRRLYSDVTRGLSPDEKKELFAHYYLPYRLEVERYVAAAVRSSRRVIHVSSHSFTPVLDGERRNTDIGLLYDPSREPEASLCLAWRAALLAAMPHLVVRRNYPYRGTSDGLTTHLRRHFRPSQYIGIEIEVNQKHALGDARRWSALRRAVTLSLRAALKSDA
ncbi:MAG: N-formylglutamate amidohydrolase [Rhodospirillaceae bacterium]